MCLRSTSKRGAFRSLVAAAALTPFLFFASQSARAEDPTLPILSPGDAVVTGFSGTLPPVAPPSGSDPIDFTFIDPDGASMRIQRLQPSGPPVGQVIAAPTLFSAKAREVGQVFAITLDDAPAPNIYLGATSAFGLQLVAPDASGIPQRIKTGQPGAAFMEGQWGAGGAPGSIYKVDGTTGAVSLFTTIGANAGPGLGDLVFDRTSHQFFVSDLDTGLIYRMDATGLITDTFDPGVDGRPAHGLPAVADDGSTMDITNPSFNAEDPATWGYTQKERMVYGMAVHGGRLFYYSDGQIWSIGIRLDGSFAHDARWELDVAGLASNDPVTDIVFDGQGRMILAQRGQQRASYDYTIFAEPKTSSVVRYRREVPDDPATPGTWVPVPEEYAIGFRPEGHNANGGVALGPAYDENGYIRENSCGETLWSTGESLRENEALAAQLAAGGPATIHGLQGNDASLVKPANDPPFQSWFADYDDQYEDVTAQGHMGDVEIYQSCAGVQGYGPYIPPYYPPPGWTPPGSGSFDLAIDKVADPRVCYPGGQGWICSYTIRVTNAGAGPYWGPVSVADWLPGNPPGSIVSFAPEPPWTCGATGPDAFQCEYPPVFLYPGEGVDLHVYVDMPDTHDLCYLENNARLEWIPGYGDANPANDFAYAYAEIPNDKCQPTGNRTNLKIKKGSLYDVCLTNGTIWTCPFVVTVTNTGPGVYNGPIQVTDQMSVPNAILYGPQPNPPNWTCSPGSGGNYTCDHAPVTLNPGESVQLVIATTVPVAEQEQAGKCTIENRAKITLAPGGSPQNTNPGDDTASAEAKTPGKNCEPIGGKSDLSLKKEGLGCYRYPVNDQSGFICAYKVTVTNEGPDNFTGPLVVRDTYTGAPTPPIFTPGWACVPAGGGAYDCNAPGPFPIAPGGSRFFATAVFVPANGDVCRIGNSASIKTPPGGSPQNTNPANDSAGPVTQVLPIDRCNPPPPRVRNIKIEKSAGACTAAAATAAQVICTFTVKVTNTGPGNASSAIGFRDIPAYGAAQVTSAPPGWNCWQGGSIASCLANPATLAVGASATFTLKVAAPLDMARQYDCSLRNSAHLKLPPVGPLNTNPADDVAWATATVPLHLCSRPVEPEACPLPQKMPNGQCCPAGSYWNGRVCAPVDTPKCPPGMIGTPPNCHPPVIQICPPGSVGVFPNCRCPAGMTGKPPNCHPPVIQVCPPGSVGVFPNCRCPPGLVGQPPNCRPPVVQVCPPGSVGVFPNCKCPAGMIGQPPNCKPIVLKCPPDSVGPGMPNCRCKPGSIGTPGQCKRVPPPQCPPGSVGNPPDCRCPAGTIGKPPNCRKPPVLKLCPPGSVGIFPDCRCPAGTIGQPPNCRKPPVLKLCPPGSVGVFPDCKCPAGQVGRPPNCRPLVIEKPPVIGKPPTLKLPPAALKPLACPQGSVGKPPNCRCPPGTTGTPGNCQAEIR